MNTKSILLETIVAGFLCLLVFILFVSLQLTNGEINKIVTTLFSISGGASALLITLMFMFSYILGSLSHRIGADLSKLYLKIKGVEESQLLIDKTMNKRMVQDYFNKWVVKSFYRSIMLLMPFILIQSLMLDYKLSSGKYFVPILLSGCLIEAISIIAFITQRKDYLQSRQKLKEMSDK